MSNALVLTLVVMLICLFLKVPVFIAILTGSLAYFLLNPTVSLTLFAQRMIIGTQSLSLLAIPFFVCAGVLMNYSGVTRRLMRFCEAVTGRLNGGLALVNVMLSTVMGGLSGSNLADAAMEAKLLVPEMERTGYSKSFSSVVTAVSSMITPLIPPGIALILYGFLANISIGKLFAAGMSVGVLLCVCLMVFVSVISKKRGYLPIRTERLKKQQFTEAFRPAILPLCLPILIIGGIRVGIFTATEAGSAAVLFSLVLGWFYREIKMKEVWKSLSETTVSTASIMLIVASATVLSWILTNEQIPQKMAEVMVQTIHNKYVFLLVVNLFLIVLGMFMEGNASTIILVPLLAPIAKMYGINEIQFAMIYIFNGSIGTITPPLGTLMFVTCGVTKCKTKDFIQEALPFYALLLFILVLLILFPWLSTWIVDLLY